MRGDQIQIRVGGTILALTGGPFQEMLAAVKGIQGRRFNSQQKLWELPGSLEQITARLEAAGYVLEAIARDTLPPAPASAEPRPAGDRIKIRLAGRVYDLVGGSFEEMLAAVKDIPGRRFSGSEKLWDLPNEPDSIQRQFEAQGFRLEGGQPASTPAPTLPLPPEPPPDEADLPFPPEEIELAPPEEPPFLADAPLWPEEPPPDLPAEREAPPEADPFRPEAGAAAAPPAPRPRSGAGERRDQIKVRVGGRAYAVVGGSFQEMLAAVKEVPGRRFLGSEKVWELPGEPDAARKLVEAAGFQMVEAD